MVGERRRPERRGRRRRRREQRLGEVANSDSETFAAFVELELV
jgi:hypothetical protein